MTRKDKPMTDKEAVKRKKAGERRDFLKLAGKAAVVTPPAMSLLLSTSLDSNAIAGSDGKSFPGKGHTGGIFPGKGKTDGVFPGGGKKGG